MSRACRLFIKYGKLARQDLRIEQVVKTRKWPILISCICVFASIYIFQVSCKKILSPPLENLQSIISEPHVNLVSRFSANYPFVTLVLYMFNKILFPFDKFFFVQNHFTECEIDTLHYS